MPIQGTEADLMKMAMIKLEQEFEVRSSELANPLQLLQIHDSILVECDQKIAQKVAEIMKETMENIYPSLGVNLAVEIHIGKDWGEL